MKLDAPIMPDMYPEHIGIDFGDGEMNVMTMLELNWGMTKAAKDGTDFDSDSMAAEKFHRWTYAVEDHALTPGSFRVTPHPHFQTSTPVIRFFFL